MHTINIPGTASLDSTSLQRIASRTQYLCPKETSFCLAGDGLQGHLFLTDPGHLLTPSPRARSFLAQGGTGRGAGQVGCRKVTRHLPHRGASQEGTLQQVLPWGWLGITVAGWVRLEGGCISIPSGIRICPAAVCRLRAALACPDLTFASRPMRTPPCPAAPSQVMRMQLSDMGSPSALKERRMVEMLVASKGLEPLPPGEEWRISSCLRAGGLEDAQTIGGLEKVQACLHFACTACWWHQRAWSRCLPGRSGRCALVSGGVLGDA